MKKIIPIALLALTFPLQAGAVIQSINGQTGSSQTFSNDTNVTITSLNNIHSFGWSGVLSLLRGGTGLSSVPSGAFLFGDGINPLRATTSPTFGWITATSSTATSSFAGNFSVLGNTRLGNLSVGILEVVTSPEEIVTVRRDLRLPKNSGSIVLRDPEDTVDWAYILPWSSGTVGLGATNVDGGVAILDLTNLVGINPERTFSFPNLSGTFSLLEANQTYTGLNKFEANSNSTIYVGSSIKSGCIAMGDSDGSGLTYITANDGVLSSTTTKPSICQ